VILVDRLTYAYAGAAAFALRDCSLEVADGETLLVAGASGTGKSTLLRAMVGLVPHFWGGRLAGRVVVFGRDTRAHPPRDLADLVGFVAQDPESQAVVDRVADEIVFAMENLGVPPVTMRKRLEETLDALGLAPLRDRRLSTLSGGERQRVAIASVLAAQPRALVLDEPTSQLDPLSAEEVLGVLQRLNQDLGIGIVLAEHRLERVVQFADRMAVLAGDGGPPMLGPPREVLRVSPVAPPLAELGRALGWDPIPLTVREGRARAAALRPLLRPLPAEPEAPGEPLVVVRGCRVALGGREVLRGIDLTVSEGETLALVGRNGAGKTTLLRALVGLLRPHAGRIVVAGRDVPRTPVAELARDVAYLPQTPEAALVADRVADEVAFTLRARGLPGRPEPVLEAFGLAALADRPPRDLAAGERLRVALAAVSAGRPRVLLLDEPTRGVDQVGKEDLARRLAGWRREGRAVVVVTHDVELVARCATRVALMAEGEIVVDGPVREVLGESPLFSSQMNKVFEERSLLTVEDVLRALGRTA
jgi:energy-coupling factor transporter ATP-binding protein EcfA2